MFGVKDYLRESKLKPKVNSNAILDAQCISPAFHGELWYGCPHCGAGIEAYDFKFERGVSLVEKGEYKNIYRCHKCSGLMRY